jgi:hypothetical protein
LSGTDPNIHDGRVDGVMRELANSFTRVFGNQPTAEEMMQTYRKVSRLVDVIQKKAKAKSIYEPAVFSQLLFVTTEAIGLPARR